MLDGQRVEVVGGVPLRVECLLLVVALGGAFGRVLQLALVAPLVLAE